MKTRNWSRVSAITVLSLTLILLGLVGCNSKSKQSDTVTNAQLSLTAPSAMSTGGTSVVVATVTQGGTALADQQINFTVTPANSGFFTPATDTTDANGEAASVFTATQSGNVTITAAVSGTNLSSIAGINVQAGQGQTGSGNVLIDFTPNLLLANGKDTSTVSITVRDGAGNLAPDSTIIRLCAGEKFDDIDGNGYWTPGVDTVIYDANGNGTWDGLGQIQSTAFTLGGDGQITVYYISGNDAMTVYIRATVDDNGIAGYAEKALQLSPNASVASIYLSADTAHLAVKGTGGLETAVIRAVCYDENGNRVPEGLQVNFTITAGPGGGEHLANVGLGPYTAVTSSAGVATCPISSGTKSGTVRVMANADTVLSEATQIAIHAGPPKYIALGAEFCNVGFWDVVGGEQKILAIVSDTFMNPVRDSTIVYFTTDEGTMRAHETRTQEEKGLAATVWISGNNLSTGDGIVQIIAETHGGDVADTSFFYNSWYPTVLTPIGAPDSMWADGVSKTTVVIDAVDLNNNPIVKGKELKADASYLLVEGGTLENGCGASSVRVRITSAKLSIDESRTYVNDDGVGAIDVIQYWTGTTASISIPVVLKTGNAYSGNSSIVLPATGVKNAAVNLSAIIKDRWNNPLGDHTLVLTVEPAAKRTILDNSAETDSYGEAFGLSFMPTDTGSFSITITDTDPRGGIMLNKSLTISQ